MALPTAAKGPADSTAATGLVATVPTTTSTAPVASAAAAVTTALTKTPANVAPRLASISAAATTVVNPNTLPPRISPLALVVGVGSVALDYVLAISRQLSLVTYWRSTPDLANPTLQLDGYNLVASSTQEITSSYGLWMNWPGGPNTVQGKQTFDVIDQQTDANLGSFDALVSSGGPLTLGGKYVQILVTSSSQGAAQVAPVGSLIANQTWGRWGWSYSAIPTGPSSNVVSFKVLTPFGSIPVPFIKFDAAQGILDHSVDNFPIDLGNGYTVAPANPDGEIYTAITGYLPLFSVVQGHQTYNVYDSDHNVVGSFEGVFSPTIDLNGAHTEAILVTKVIDGTAGINPGQVPPVGSVYNILFLAPGTDGRHFLYSSMPSQSGDVVSFLDFNKNKVTNVATFPFTSLNASAPPLIQRLQTTGGDSFYPISPLQVSGINGLPPREAEVQGYQQFGVYDKDGNQIGSFDADVSTQWDILGAHSHAIMVTKVTSGTVGTGAGEVPPVGSVFDYVSFGNTGLGTYYAAIPSTSGGNTKTTFKLVTPLLNIPLFTKFDASKDPSDYTFYDPF